MLSAVLDGINCITTSFKNPFFTGALLRAEQKIPGSEYRHVIEENNVNGTIVPITITCSLLMREMKKSEKILRNPMIF